MLMQNFGGTNKEYYNGIFDTEMLELPLVVGHFLCIEWAHFVECVNNFLAEFSIIFFKQLSVNTVNLPSSVRIQLCTWEKT